MNKNKILSNLNHAVLVTFIPLLLVACGKKHQNVDAELATVNERISNTEAQLDSLESQTSALTADSISRDPRIQELSAEIQKYETAKNKFTAPKDSTLRRKCSRKISSLYVDSVLQANRIKEHITKANVESFRAVYNEQNALIAKRDSLLKIKGR